MSIEVVKRIKAELEAAGVNLSGPCGAFEITNRVALALGAGVLEKTGGNNCRGRSVDYIVFAAGPAYDILGDAGGANIPQFNQDNDPALLLRRRTPFAVAATGPGETPPQPAEPNDLAGVLTAVVARLTVLEQLVWALSENQAASERMDARRYDLLFTAINSRPVYVGNLRIPYLGTVPVELTPRT